MTTPYDSNTYDELMSDNFRTPKSFLMQQRELPADFYKRTTEKTLFFMFYNLPKDQLQSNAADELARRGWKYLSCTMRWKKDNLEFDPVKWVSIAAR